MRARYAKQSTALCTTSSGPRNYADPELPSDSICAFEVIAREASSSSSTGKGGFPLSLPGCFVHQIHVLVKDKTDVANELELARMDGILRQIKVDSIKVVFVVRETDYVGLATALWEEAEKDKQAELEAKVLRAFVEIVLPSVRDLGVAEVTLGKLCEERRLSAQDVASTLCKLGFLVYQTNGRNTGANSKYWFAVPQMRTLVEEVEAGREAFIKAIRFAKPKGELLKSKLATKLGECKKTSLSVDFLIKDAVGMGLVVARETPVEGPSSLFLLHDKMTRAMGM